MDPGGRQNRGQTEDRETSAAAVDWYRPHLWDA
jgi:hypothetical protein